MAWSATLTVGATDTSGGPFPPNYPEGASGYVAAGSNPSGDSAGSLSYASYFGATILAIANDAAGAGATQLLVALQGQFDQTFLGAVTTPDTQVYEPTATSAFLNTTVNGVQVTVWIWLLDAGAVALANGTVDIADTGDTLIDLQGAAPSPTEIALTWTNSGPTPPENYVLYRGVGSTSPTEYQTLAGTVLEYNDTGLASNSVYTYYVVANYTDGTASSSVELQLFTPTTGVSQTFNCNCESIPLPADGWTIDSLANLRKRVLIRSGYAAQASNPPPGMVLLVNEFLREAQNQLYRMYFNQRIIMMYAWQMEVNQRYYGFDQSESPCRTIDPLGIDWVGFEDLNQAWYPLICGIDPVLYTRAQISTGWPTHYEIRQCIEIFPAPRANYTLWIKGKFGLDPFTADTDNTTVDAEAVFLLATGFCKSHYGQADAGNLLTQADTYVKQLVAGSHQSRRYVPRTRVQTPMTPPRFLPMEE